MQIDLARSGGVAGITMRTSVDTSTLPSEEAEEIEQAMRGIDFAKLGRDTSTGGTKPDRFQYDLTVTIGDQRHELSAAEQDLPPELRRLLDRLLRRR